MEAVAQGCIMSAQSCNRTIEQKWKEEIPLMDNLVASYDEAMKEIDRMENSGKSVSSL